MKKHALHISLAQINPIVGDIEGNLERIIRTIDLTPPNTDLIVFPEMVICGYPSEDLVLNRSFIEHIEKAIDKIIDNSKNHNKAVIIPCPTYNDGKIYNSAHIIESGKIIATIHKHHLPNYGVFDEARVFTQGGIARPVEFRGHKLGIMICEDMWSKDVAFRLKKNGAELLISVNASPYDIDKSNIRLEHAIARTKETSLPLIYVNQVGGQDELVFDGSSFIINENGTIVMRAKEFVEDICNSTWEKINNGHWLCITNEINKIYKGEKSIYQALMLGLRDYVGKNNFPSVIIGMSGGIDSALSAAIACDALGAENVHLVMMPSPFTSKESLDDAEKCARALKARYDVISIKPAMAAFEKMIDGLKGVAHENMQARARGLTLMALSNSTNGMVLSTGNKSEIAVGYATLYGDMCGGFNALKDVYKTQVYKLAHWRNNNIPDHSLCNDKNIIPQNIINRAPSAELRPEQRDDDFLPPYDILDGILKCLIEKDMGVNQTVNNGFDREIVIKIKKLLDIAEYKRRQAAPGVKITYKSFGKDRRYPITNRFVEN